MIQVPLRPKRDLRMERQLCLYLSLRIGGKVRQEIVLQRKGLEVLRVHNSKVAGTSLAPIIARSAAEEPQIVFSSVFYTGLQALSAAAGIHYLNWFGAVKPVKVPRVNPRSVTNNAVANHR